MNRFLASVIAVSVSVLVAVPATAAPRPVQFVRIVGHQDQGRFAAAVEPDPELRLHRFTRVLWTNGAERPVRLRLGSGEKCTEVSGARLRIVDAKLLAAGCHVTETPIGSGGVLETQFYDPGRFRYEVEYLGEKAKESGDIVVY
jgi:hypothetical protein